MTDEHERYEALAVGHVLGGLDAADAAAFRSHLLGCRDCRSRVAELRDIAADLAAAERDERARSRVRTEVARRVDRDEDDGSGGEEGERDPSPPRIGIRHVTVAAIVVVVLAAAMAFWNLHLRTTTATYAAVADQRGETLRELATGVPVDVELGEDLSGMVAVDGDQVAFTLTGLAELRPGERLVAWLTGGEDGDVPALLVQTIEGDTVAATVSVEGATELVLTRERGDPGEGPIGEELLRAPIR
jgi:anti-sigma factor RsiW